MTEQEQVDRGAKAQALLSSPIFQEVFADIREEQVRSFFESKPAQTEEREHLYRLRLAVDAIEAQLIQYVEIKNNILTEKTFDDE